MLKFIINGKNHNHLIKAQESILSWALILNTYFIVYIYPKEIEDFLYTHPKVQDVQVIGVPDKDYGEEIMACVILKKGETADEAEIKQYVLDHMAKHKVPKYVDFVTEFPMNAAGKILKYKMREAAVEKLNLQKANSIVTA